MLEVNPGSYNNQLRLEIEKTLADGVVAIGWWQRIHFCKQNVWERKNLI
jgi:hypothetical protein